MSGINKTVIIETMQQDVYTIFLKKRGQIVTLMQFIALAFFICCANMPGYRALSQQAFTAYGSIDHSPKATTQIPVLCYHQVREWTAADSKSSRVYIMPVETFHRQMTALHDSGYHTILPAQLIDYLKTGRSLPSKPVLITFDDGTISQYTNALPVLEQTGFNAVFFIMTVTLGRPGYLSSNQVRALSARGFIIGCHTWDHHSVTAYNDIDWKKQLIQPTRLLEQITGKEIKYFAYPFGAWNRNAVQQLKAQKYAGAFQLAGKQNTSERIFTIRRIIADSHWSGAQLIHAMKNSFR